MDFLKKKMKELLDDDDKPKPQTGMYRLSSIDRPHHLLTRSKTHMEVLLVLRQLAMLAMGSAQQPTITTADLARVAIHRNSSNIHHRAKATLLRVPLRVILLRDTLSSNHTVKEQVHRLDPLHLSGRLRPFHRAGLIVR